MTFVVTTSRKLHTANNYRVKLFNGDSVETMSIELLSKRLAIDVRFGFN